MSLIAEFRGFSALVPNTVLGRLLAKLQCPHHMSSTENAPTLQAGIPVNGSELVDLQDGSEKDTLQSKEVKDDEISQDSPLNESNYSTNLLGRHPVIEHGRISELHDAARGITSQDNDEKDEAIEARTQALSLAKSLSYQEHQDNDRHISSTQADSSVQSTREEEYMDPTPKTPRYSHSPARSETNEASPLRNQTGLDPTYGSRSQNIDGDRRYGNGEKLVDQAEGEGDDDSKSEIQSIMDQFDSSEGGQYEDEVMSSGLEVTTPKLQTSVYHPPRKSSLEPFGHTDTRLVAPPESTTLPSSYITDLSELNQQSSSESPRTPSVRSLGSPQAARSAPGDSRFPPSPQVSMSTQKIPPPEPDPEPDLPFDFHRFLEQLRHRTADPVAKFLRSFLVEFGKKQWMVHEQVKIISDFLAFITNKMAQCEIWRGVSDAEFDNAKEGMEKLVMNRLYSQTFSPAIPPTLPVQDIKGKKKNVEKLLGPARKGQHQEDIERDDILGQKIRIYGWVEENHLDIPPVDESGRRFLSLAQQGS